MPEQRYENAQNEWLASGSRILKSKLIILEPCSSDSSTIGGGGGVGNVLLLSNRLYCSSHVLSKVQ